MNIISNIRNASIEHHIKTSNGSKPYHWKIKWGLISSFLVLQKYEKYLLYANEHTIFFLFSVKSNTKHLVNFTRYFSFLSCITSITCKYDIFWKYRMKGGYNDTLYFWIHPQMPEEKKQNYDTKNIEKKHRSLLIWKLLYTFVV